MASETNGSEGKQQDATRHTPALPSDKLVDAAVRFLSNPDVRRGSVEKKKEFLGKRGLNESQIAEALYRSAIADNQPGRSATGSSPGTSALPPDVDGGRPWLVYAVLAGILTGAGAGLYNIYQLYILPYLEQRDQEAVRLQQLEAAVETTQTALTATVDNLKNSISSIQESVRRIESDVTTIKTTGGTSFGRDDALAGVRTEIQTVKSLLLSRNQFASAPVQRTPTIPAWQRAASSSPSLATSSAAAAASTAATSTAAPVTVAGVVSASASDLACNGGTDSATVVSPSSAAATLVNGNGSSVQSQSSDDDSSDARAAVTNTRTAVESSSLTQALNGDPGESTAEQPSKPSVIDTSAASDVSATATVSTTATAAMPATVNGE